jgi:hypothetical protein
MSAKFRSLIKVLAVILVAIAVLLQLQLITISGLEVYNFWLVIIAFGLLMISSR